MAAADKLKKFADLMASMADATREFQEFCAIRDKEVKKMEAHAKRLKNKTATGRGRKLKPFEFSDDFMSWKAKLEREKIETEDKEEYDKENAKQPLQGTEPISSNRPKRRAAEKAVESVKKGYDFENCRKLRRPDSSEAGPSSVPCVTPTNTRFGADESQSYGTPDTVVKLTPHPQLSSMKPVVVLEKLPEQEILRHVDTFQRTYEVLPGVREPLEPNVGASSPPSLATNGSSTQAGSNQLMFTTPAVSAFAIGAPFTTGGLQVDKENFYLKTLVRSAGRPKSLKAPWSKRGPLEPSNKLPVSVTKSVPKCPTFKKAANHDNPTRHRELEKKKYLEMIRNRQLNRRESSGRKRAVPVPRNEKPEPATKKDLLMKKKVNELKAEKALERRKMQEQARIARIEKQKEEMRKAAEIRQKELAEEKKLQEQRKKEEKLAKESKNRLAKLARPIQQPNEDKEDENNIGLILLPDSSTNGEEAKKKVAKWAHFGCPEFQRAIKAQGTEPEITLKKARGFFQRPNVTPDTTKIFGRFAAVRPRTSSAVWNDTIALSLNQNED